MPRMPKVALHTLGCKLNYAETSTLGKQFLDRGYEVVGFGEQADVCVINTCSVTERADRECRQMIRRALRTSARPYVIVTGCYAQLEPEEVASIEGVDLVLGAKEKFDLFAHAGALEKGRYPVVQVSDIDSVENFGPAYSTSAADRTRAFLKVQDGCDFNCSFCTIPMARGASRSQGIDESVMQARELVNEGYREIVLTGVNVGDYGRKKGSSLGALLKRLVGLDGLERIRISSIEPNLLSDEILEFVASHDKMCKHFHIPLQSGNDEILRAMRRRYTTSQYAALIGKITGAIPDCGIGVDVIAGFPGESDAHFESTHRFIAGLPVSYLHVFTYSERPGTPAPGFGSHVHQVARSKRNRMLRVLGEKKRAAFGERMVGKKHMVLAEEAVDDGVRYGFTGNYVRVGMPSEETKGNALLEVEIVAADSDFCRGRVVRGELRE